MAIAFVENVEATDTGTSHTSGTLSAVNAGDLLVMCQEIQATISTVTNPSGWSVAISDDNDNAAFSGQIIYKIASAGDPTSYITSTSGSVAVQQGLARFTGADQSTPLRTTNGNDLVGTNNSCTPGSITPVTNELLIAMIAQANTNGGSEAVGSSYNLLGAANLSKLLYAYILAPNTTALNPSFTWTTGVGILGLHAAFNVGTAVATPPERHFPRGLERGLTRGVA